jgi:hypothetical protein
MTKTLMNVQYNDMFKLKKNRLILVLVFLLLYHFSASAKEKQMSDIKPITFGSIEISVQEDDDMKWSGPIPVRIEKVIGTKIPKNESNSVIWVHAPPLELYPKDPGPVPEGMSIDYMPRDIRVQSMILKKDILEVSFINEEMKTQIVQVEPKTGKMITIKVQPPKQ